MSYWDKRPMQKGKVKDIYDLGNGELLFVYSDRLSSHDVMLADTVPHKGQVLCRLSTHCFENCEKKGIKTHVIDVPEANKMIGKKLSIIPIEVIGRNYVYGSYWKRYKQGKVQLPNGTDPLLAARLSEPVIEFTTKFEAKDRPIEDKQIVSNGWLEANEITQIEEVTLKIKELMMKDASRGGLILSDFKLEFGKDDEGEIILADEAETPDTCRFWDASTYQPGRVQNSFDKQVVRDYLEKVKGWNKAQPPPGTRLKQPILPDEIIRKTSQRYIEAYERLTDRRFKKD